MFLNSNPPLPKYLPPPNIIIFLLTAIVCNLPEFPVSITFPAGFSRTKNVCEQHGLLYLNKSAYTRSIIVARGGDNLFNNYYRDCARKKKKKHLELFRILMLVQFTSRVIERRVVIL